MFPTPTPMRTRRRRRRRRGARSPWVLLVPLAVLAVLLLLVQGGSDSGRSAREKKAGSPVAAFIDELAQPWPKHQRPDGVHFPGLYSEPVSGGTRYGDSMEGYAEVLTGFKTHQQTLIDSGLRALNFGAGRAHLHTRPSIFEI